MGARTRTERCRQRCARALLLSAVVAFSNGLGAQASARSGALSDLIINLARYTNWPTTANRTHLTVCYAQGGDLAPAAIDTSDTTTLRGMPVQWRQVQDRSQLGDCAVLFLNADVWPAPRDWVVAVATKPVLTISNYADFTADGGIIGAWRNGEDWRFEINLEALQRARLNIAAVALRLSQKPKSHGAERVP